MSPLLDSDHSTDLDTPEGLTPDQLQAWDRDGYLIIPNALSPTTVSTLLAETHSMLSSFPLDTHPMTRFTTGETSSHVGDEYFLTSGNKVHYFFEEAAFDPTSGALTKPKHRAINKIGHYLHELSPAFKRITLTPRNAAIARSLRFSDPRVLQSMLICKQPEIGGAVPAHQDSTFLYTDPPSAVGFWYALEDATAGNGCLSFRRGSHRRTPVRERFVRRGDAEGGGTGFVSVEGGRWARDVEPGSEVGEGEGSENTGNDATGEEEQQEEEYELGEVKAGTLVLIHGNLLHKSEKNTSGKSRFIYTFHVIEGENEYDERNWLQPSEKGFSRLPS